ncbi:hypothetical protein [Thermodesulfobacterium sp. TA1]|nr:hypothetical protein [Thermodesulfobacterium sp. TA1]
MVEVFPDERAAERFIILEDLIEVKSGTNMPSSKESLHKKTLQTRDKES